MTYHEELKIFLNNLANNSKSITDNDKTLLNKIILRKISYKMIQRYFRPRTCFMKMVRTSTYFPKLPFFRSSPEKLSKNSKSMTDNRKRILYNMIIRKIYNKNALSAILLDAL